MVHLKAITMMLMISSITWVICVALQPHSTNVNYGGVSNMMQLHMLGHTEDIAVAATCRWQQHMGTKLCIDGLSCPSKVTMCEAHSPGVMSPKINILEHMSWLQWQFGLPQAPTLHTPSLKHDALPHLVNMMMFLYHEVMMVLDLKASTQQPYDLMRAPWDSKGHLTRSSRSLDERVHQGTQPDGDTLEHQPGAPYYDGQMDVIGSTCDPIYK